jgi:hypothetical protein
LLYSSISKRRRTAGKASKLGFATTQALGRHPAVEMEITLKSTRGELI